MTKANFSNTFNALYSYVNFIPYKKLIPEIHTPNTFHRNYKLMKGHIFIECECFKMIGDHRVLFFISICNLSRLMHTYNMLCADISKVRSLGCTL